MNSRLNFHFLFMPRLSHLVLVAAYLPFRILVKYQGKYAQPWVRLRLKKLITTRIRRPARPVIRIQVQRPVIPIRGTRPAHCTVIPVAANDRTDNNIFAYYLYKILIIHFAPVLTHKGFAFYALRPIGSDAPRAPQYAPKLSDPLFQLAERDPHTAPSSQ